MRCIAQIAGLNNALQTPSMPASLSPLGHTLHRGMRSDTNASESRPSKQELETLIYIYVKDKNLVQVDNGGNDGEHEAQRA